MVRVGGAPIAPSCSLYLGRFAEKTDFLPPLLLPVCLLTGVRVGLVMLTVGRTKSGRGTRGGDSGGRDFAELASIRWR